MNRYLFWTVELICLSKHVNNIWRKNYDKIILISEKNLSDINCKRSEKTLIYIKRSLIVSDDNIYLISDSLKEINKIITIVNNTTLKKVNVKPYGYD